MLPGKEGAMTQLGSFFVDAARCVVLQDLEIISLKVIFRLTQLLVFSVIVRICATK